MAINAFHSGVQRTITSVRAFHGGAWRTIAATWGFRSGAWRQISGTPAPAPAPPPAPTTFSVAVSNAGAAGECAYSAAYNPRSCTSSSNHTATPTNNVGTVSYAWSFPSNPGGFTIAGSSTAQTVRISAFGVAGGYQCTLRCTATDGGTGGVTSTDIGVSHTHEAE